MKDNEIDFEVIILDKNEDSFIDEYGIYEFFNGSWCDVSYGSAIYTKQVIH